MQLFARWEDWTHLIFSGVLVTYSIVAKCKDTGQFGVGIQSHFFASGDACWAKAGIGVVVTQAMALMDHGPLGLELLELGFSASEALEIRLEADPESEIRQVAIIDSDGLVAAHTGTSTIPSAGHVLGDGFSCQANLMWNDMIPSKMAKEFSNKDGKLSERILAALQAGQEAGGDLRGMQSARILVVKANISEKSWEEKIVDIRIDDHPAPLDELGRLLKVHSTYTEFQEGGYELDLEESEMEIYPEIAFWTGVNLAVNGDIENGKKLINIALQDHDGWIELLHRCSEINFFGRDEALVKNLLTDE